MATGNFSFLLKKFSPLFLSFVVLAACQNLRTREDIKNEQQEEERAETPSGPVQPPKYEGQIPSQPQPPATQPAPPVSSPIPAIPKIGLILGPGGARAYGHIGALQNLSRLKVPIYATVGIEWGAPAAALLSSKGQVYDVEWQMFKLKDDELSKKSLIGSSGKTDVTALKEFWRAICIPRTWPRIDSEMARPAASSPAFTMREPLANACAACSARACCLLSTFWAEIAPMFV